MTISFSYAYLNGLDRFIVSSLCVVTAVHRLSRATSPRMTGRQKSLRTAPKLTVHKDCLGDIVRVVSGDDVVYSELRCTAI